MRDSIKNYRICQKRIGKGSFSTIHKCFNLNNDVFALKNINVTKLKDKTIIKNEYNLIRNLSHINVVKVYELIYDTELNNIYMILEFFENGDLSKYLSGKSLTEEYANNFSIQIKDGLQYLLSKNILHRDLKPQNILVSKNKILKISDFGLSKYIDNDNIMNTVCGSPLYMAPEIIKYRKYTVKSDIWSFGVIIYEMVYGYMPIKSDNIYDLISFLRHKHIRFLPTVSYDCLDLMKFMLQKNQEDRISWKQLFDHKWLNNNILLKKENKLLEININSSIENSYKYTSISEKLDNSLDFNFNFNFNFRSNNSIKSNIDSPTSTYNSSLYLSFDDSETEGNDDTYSVVNNTEKTKNINIPCSKENSFIMIYKDEIDSYSKNNQHQYQEKKTLSENIKNYLNNSITFVKQSCDYINKSSSL